MLTENFFMDNFEEYKNFLMTAEGRQRIINFHVKEFIDLIKNNEPLGTKVIIQIPLMSNS